MSFFKIIEIIILVSIGFFAYLKMRKIYLKNTRKEVKSEGELQRDLRKKEHNLEMKLQRNEMSNAAKVERSENIKKGLNDYVAGGGLKNDVGSVAKVAVDYKLNNFDTKTSSTQIKER